MDSHFPATKEDLHYVHMDVKHVQAVQINHADRLLRLERRQADDAALKSVWGTGNPFPGILSGTPVQGPVQNPSGDVFDDFDDEQGQSLLSRLQLETDEEPVRRGASRANSVRFDVSARQGSNWAQSSRNSGDFGPTRPSSGFGSHHMIERTSSHKSDGRHSSAGHSVHSIHSVHSGRTSSLGLDTNFIIGGPAEEDSPLEVAEPPPGLFVLGSVPSIIRCWLTTKFSHSALLYGVVCTGSQRSFLEYSLVNELGLAGQIQKHQNSHSTIRLPVYLPEAIITHPASRSISPASQLPTFTSDFEIVGLNQRTNPDRNTAIRVFIGSDTLRAHNADVLFSQNLMTLYADDRNKLSVPFVRPEDEAMFKSLGTANIPPEKIELKATAAPFAPTAATPGMVDSLLNGEPDPTSTTKSEAPIQRPFQSDQPLSRTANKTMESLSLDQAVGPKPEQHVANGGRPNLEKRVDIAAPVPLPQASECMSADRSRRESSGAIWGSWRQGTASNSSDNGDFGSSYQTTAKSGRNMKVLKPSKPIAVASFSSLSSSAARSGAAYESAPVRPLGEIRRKSQVGGAENAPLRWESKGVVTNEQKWQRAIVAVPKSSNPVGGASAFAWMNPGKPKVSATTAE